MAEYLIQDTTLTNIANPIKTLMGVSGTLTPADMASNLNDANTAVENALAALIEKEVEVPDGTNVTGLAALIAAIEAGGAKVATGSFTPTADQIIQTITHNLGEVPSFILYYRATAYSEALTSSTWYVTAVFGYNQGEYHMIAERKTGYNGEFGNTSKSFELSDNMGPRVARNGTDTALGLKVISDTNVIYNVYFKAGITYNWLAIGGLS